MCRPNADADQPFGEAHKLGYYTNPITSGVGMDADRVARFRELGLDHIQVSFQAVDRVLNDRIAGTEAFEHKLAYEHQDAPPSFRSTHASETSIVPLRQKNANGASVS